MYSVSPGERLLSLIEGGGKLSPKSQISKNKGDGKLEGGGS